MTYLFNSLDSLRSTHDDCFLQICERQVSSPCVEYERNYTDTGALSDTAGLSGQRDEGELHTLVRTHHYLTSYTKGEKFEKN